MKNGALVISLDFELVWGIFDVVDYTTKEDYFNNTRRIIPKILSAFHDNDIHATWAVVGMLFNKDWEEWVQNKPNKTPQYKEPSLSAYNFAEKLVKSVNKDFFFAPDLIKIISRTKGQEIATHTYSHYYCLEPGQNVKSFQQDLEQAIAVASEFGINLKSLVFPRNQVEPDYLEVCKAKGIVNVRVNPDAWYWRNKTATSITNKVARTGDVYLPFGKKTYKKEELKKQQELPLQHKASRFLRPHEDNNFLRQLKLRRIKHEMMKAALYGEIYHLWWHPHNFGDKPEQNLNDLNSILSYFSELRDRYNFKSLNMQELGEKVLLEN